MCWRSNDTVIKKVAERDFSICRENSCLLYIQGWKKITSKQFKNAYLAVMKDIQDPDLGDRIGSNWNTVYNSIVTSVNS